MSRTPIPDDLVHDPQSVETDARILDRLCAIATEMALPAVRDALARETMRDVARIWIDDARALLDEVIVEGAAPRDGDVDAVTADFEPALAGGVPAPSEDEVGDHAEALSRALVGGWLQTLADIRANGRQLAWPELLPDGPADTSADWSNFWKALAPFATNRTENFELLRDTCRAAAGRDRGDNAKPVALPMGLEVPQGQLLKAIETAGKTVSLRDLLVPLSANDMFDGLEPVGAGAFGVTLRMRNGVIVKIRTSGASGGRPKAGPGALDLPPLVDRSET